MKLSSSLTDEDEYCTESAFESLVYDRLMNKYEKSIGGKTHSTKFSFFIEHKSLIYITNYKCSVPILIDIPPEMKGSCN